MPAYISTRVLSKEGRMNKNPIESFGSDDELIVLHYYGELDDASKENVKKRLEKDVEFSRRYSEIAAFLKLLPDAPDTMPTTQEWQKIREHIASEGEIHRSLQKRIRRVSRLRMLWAAAVYLMLIFIGVFWSFQLSRKPSPLVLQAYGTRTIIPGSDMSLRVVARLREKKKFSKSELEVLKQEYRQLIALPVPESFKEGSTQETSVPDSAYEEDELSIKSPDMKMKEDADAQEGEFPIRMPELEVLPKTEWNPNLVGFIGRFSLEKDGFLSEVPVRLSLVSTSGRELLYKGKTNISGTIDESFPAPVKIGENPTLVISAFYHGSWQTLEYPVSIERNLNIILSHDKPRYQPGQTIHMRTLVTDRSAHINASNLKVFFQVEAPDGTKLMREPAKTSEWGIASIDFKLADLVPLGDYTLRVIAGEQEETATVKVDRYKLPPIKIAFEPDREWAFPGDTISGNITASYYFGKPVSEGEAHLEFTYFDVEEVTAGVVEGSLDSSGKFNYSFKLPEKMFARDPYNNTTELNINIEITDSAGQRHTVSRQLPVSEYEYVAKLIPESGAWHMGLDNYVYFTISKLDGTPWSPEKVIFESPTRQNPALEISPGLYSGLVKASETGDTVRVTCWDDEDNRFEFFFSCYEYETRPPFLIHTDKVVYEPGESIKVKVFYPSKFSQSTVYLDVVCGKQIILTKSSPTITGIADFEFTVTPQMLGKTEIRAYIPTDAADESELLYHDRRVIFVKSDSPVLSVSMTPDRTKHSPGESASLTIALKGAKGNPTSGAVGLVAIDSKVLGVEDKRTGLENIYYSLLLELMDPKVEIHPGDLDRVIHTLPSVEQVFKEIKPQIEESRIDAARKQLEYTYQALGRAVAAREGVLYSELYPVSKSTADSELERFEKHISSARRSASFGIPLVLLGLVLIIFIISLVQHMAFEPENLSRKLWLSYRRLSVTALLPSFIMPLSVFLFAVSREAAIVVSIAIALVGVVTSTISAKVIGEQINLYRVKSMILAAAYFVAGLWIYLVASGQVSFLTEYESIWALVITAALSLSPVFLAVAFMSNNLEHPFTGKQFTAARYAAKTAWIIGVLILIAAALWIPTSRLQTKAYMEGADILTAGIERNGLAEEAAMAPRGITTEKHRAPQAAWERPKPVRVRKHFPETMLWVPEIIVDESGQTDYTFELADSITTWNITATANDRSGNVAIGNLEMPVAADFFIDFDLPVELTRGDKISIPVVVYNYLDSPQSFHISLKKEKWFETSKSLSRSITLKPNEVRSVHFPITANEAGAFTMTASASGRSGGSDALVRDVRVVPDGREFKTAENGKLEDGKASLTAQVPEGIVPGSGKVLLKVYGGAFSQVVDGIDGVFKMPSGCFEQTSSTTYPNVMALNYMNKSGQLNPELEMRAKELVSLGYQRLVTFEVEGGGFDWFGETPADLLLTAYGLMGFIDMAEVSYVDSELIERTREWLISQAEPGTMLFRGSGHWYESIGNLAEGELTTNAYIVWALARAGVTEGELFNAVNYIKDSGTKNEDPYALALAINALLAIEGESDQTKLLSKRLVDMAESDETGLVWWEAKNPTFTYGQGNSADVETTALAAYALIRADAGIGIADKALDWLVSRKMPDGTWGSTQATVLSLKTLIAASESLAYNGTGTVNIRVADEVVRTIEIDKESADVTHFIDLSQFLETSNKVDISISDSNEKSKLYYQLETTYNLPWKGLRDTPVVNEFELDVSYDRKNLAVDDSVNVEVTARYIGPGETGMVVLDLPVPPGFDVWTPDLDELAGSGVISRWEKTANHIIIYIRGMKRDESLVIRYRLKALYPIEAAVGPSRIYEYYDPDNLETTGAIKLTVA